MDVAALASTYERASDDELTQHVVADYDLTRAIVAAHPELAQDAGFELFDRDWAKRYWRRIVSEVTSHRTADAVYSWTLEATVSGLAKLLIDHYNLPEVALSAAVALAVILLRAAKAARE